MSAGKLPTQTCILCLTPTAVFSREHIVPDVLVSNANENMVVADAICRKCNSRCGATVDAAFLNNDYVRLVRLIYADCTSSSKVPRFVTRATSLFLDQHGNRLVLDALVDNQGSRYEFNKKPKITADGNTIEFIRRRREAQSIADDYRKRGWDAEVTPLVPDTVLKGAVTVHIKPSMPPLDILVKMFLEFVHLHFGRERALDHVFDALRSHLLNPSSNTPMKWRMIYDWPSLRRVPGDRAAHCRHVIRLRSDPSVGWVFSFTMFGRTIFETTVPPTVWYKECATEILTRRSC